MRLWRDNNDDVPQHRKGRAVWRASLEDSLTGERQGFVSLDDLFAFLRCETGGMADTDDDDIKARESSEAQRSAPTTLE